MKNPNNSVPVRRLAKSEIEKQLSVGQRVNVETISETFIVISIADDGSTVELLSANGAFSMLRKVRVTDLSSAPAEPDKGSLVFLVIAINLFATFYLIARYFSEAMTGF